MREIKVIPVQREAEPIVHRKKKHRIDYRDKVIVASLAINVIQSVIIYVLQAGPV